MTIHIVTDSTCDIPPEIAAQYDISIVPCYINIGDISYRDGIDISRRDFYSHLPYYRDHPKTSAPGAGLFADFYKKLAAEGVSQIISMHIHNGLSNLANAASIAAETIDSIKVTVVEIGQLALGLGFMVLTAARAALENKSLEQVLAIIKEYDTRTYIYAALDTTDYLKASGRVPGLVVGIANLLKIKPLLSLHEGNLRLAGQVRTSSKGVERLLEMMNKLGPLERIAVLHTNAVERANQLVERVKTGLHENIDIWVSEVTPVLGVHVGPGAVGLVCVKANR